MSKPFDISRRKVLAIARRGARAWVRPVEQSRKPVEHNRGPVKRSSSKAIRCEPAQVVVNCPSAPKVWKARQVRVDAGGSTLLVCNISSVSISRGLVTGIVLPPELVLAAAIGTLVLMVEGEGMQELVSHRPLPVCWFKEVKAL